MLRLLRHLFFHSTFDVGRSIFDVFFLVLPGKKQLGAYERHNAQPATRNPQPVPRNPDLTYKFGLNILLKIVNQLLLIIVQITSLFQAVNLN